MCHKSPVKPLRLRETLLLEGAKALSDVELVAAFISSGGKQKSCLELAHSLLHHVGDLRALLNADAAHFCKVHGIGIVRFVQLKAALEICRRSDLIALKKEVPLTSVHQTHAFLKRQLRDKKNETFVALFLDTQHRVLAYEELFSGTIHKANVHARPIITRALELNAASIILAHNHPSGVSNASAHDKAMTQTLKKAFALVDLNLIDHLVIGDNEVYSITKGRKWVCH